MAKWTFTMRWLVGFGLRGHCLGAAAFAVWLSDHERGAASLFGLHLLAQQELFGLAQRAMEELANDTGGGDRFEELRTVDGDDNVGSFVDACAAYDVDGVVLGRRAPMVGETTLRLGSLARRMLRKLPRPVAIVPPDWTREAAADGPVVVGVDLTDASAVALAFSRALARMLGRRLELCHVSSAASHWGIEALSPAALDRIETDVLATARADLTEFCARHRVQDKHVVHQGDVVERLVHHATERESPILVTGSRQLGRFARLFSNSVGSELAATAPIPVFVVPPPEPIPT